MFSARSPQAEQRTNQVSRVLPLPGALVGVAGGVGDGERRDGPPGGGEAEFGVGGQVAGDGGESARSP